MKTFDVLVMLHAEMRLRITADTEEEATRSAQDYLDVMDIEDVLTDSDTKLIDHDWSVEDATLEVDEEGQEAT